MSTKPRATQAGQLPTMKTDAEVLAELEHDLRPDDVGRVLEALQGVRDYGGTMTELEADIALRLYAYLELRLEEWERRAYGGWVRETGRPD